MGPSRKIFYSACSLLPVGMLKRMAPRLLLPYHHLVSDEEVLHVKHLYPYKNIAQFSADLDTLLRHFRPVAADEVAAAVRGGKALPRNAFLLTFDDGFRQVAEIIAPILLAKGVPAVFFVNPAFLDNRLLFYRCKISLVIEALMQKKGQPQLWTACGEILGQAAAGLISRIKKIDNLNQDLLERLAPLLELSFDEYLRNKRPFLTSAEAWELQKKGFTIGAHSWDHPYYDLIPEEEQRRQTLESMEYVREKFAPSYNLFSFPHTDAGLPQGFFDRLFASGAPIDVFFGIQNQKEERSNRMLHRFNAERPDLPMARQLNGVLMYMLLQKMSGKYKVVRRSGGVINSLTNEYP
ncbi:MAG: polysaccharide deacetylase family protein [Bacteroidota bacterium]|nr:polysaccharide deacetylase family protein [Bacteroidota bacterium]MDP4254166.1 polysaccharide deacetylase family protein [Bacteroidota bacterium]